jgi:hypothetical protein
LSAAVQELPAKSDIGLANWNWKVVRQFVLEGLGISLSRSSCLNYLHRLGFVLKRPKKRLVKVCPTRVGVHRSSENCETPLKGGKYSLRRSKNGNSNHNSGSGRPTGKEFP